MSDPSPSPPSRGSRVTAQARVLEPAVSASAVEGNHGNDGLLLGRPLDEPEQAVADKSLLEILDGMVMMYSLSVHQQLGKVTASPPHPHPPPPVFTLRPLPDGGGFR